MSEAPNVQTDPPLDELVRRVQEAKSLLAQVKEHADTASADLKEALRARMATGQERIEYRAPTGVTASVTYSTTWRVDSKRLKSEAPETYARFARETPSWTLRLSV